MRILVSGAGIAGLSAGISLGTTGHDVTIIERAHQLRTAGAPVDVRGDAIGIVKSMGILDQIRAHRVSMTETAEFVAADGAPIATLPLEEVVNDSADDIEIPREDLARILRAALNSSTKLIFGESIRKLCGDHDGVEVSFVSGQAERFDLVVGADGLHSHTRRLSFGPERKYLRHLGLYIALTTLPNATHGERPTSQALNWPGHMIGALTYQKTTLGMIYFRAPWIDYDYRDLEAQRCIVLSQFAGHDEWRVPEILDAVRHDADLYFDSASQIHLPAWHRGRIVLIGDAAHCTSALSGRGTAAAILGASELARALQDHPDDITAALQHYEALHRPYVTYAQHSAGPGGDILVPATREALDARNQALRQTL